MIEVWSTITDDGKAYDIKLVGEELIDTVIPKLGRIPYDVLADGYDRYEDEKYVRFTIEIQDDIGLTECKIIDMVCAWEEIADELECCREEEDEEEYC